MDNRMIRLLGFLDRRAELLQGELLIWPSEVTEAKLETTLEIREYVQGLISGSG